MKKNNEKLGEINVNHFGTKMQIIAYKNYLDIDVMFLDDFFYVVKHTTYGNFKKGSISNPYDPTCFGIGYEGIGEYTKFKNKKETKAYITWSGMINRCYGNKKSSYYNICSISKTWLNFQNFAKWYEENEYEVEGRLHLDKDILYPGNKIYSPHHCLLVPQRINMLFTNQTNKRGLPNGITKSGIFYAAVYNGESLGKSTDLLEAYDMYAKRKKEVIVEIANDYKDIIPNKLYQALLNYKVKIENDKNYKLE